MAEVFRRDQKPTEKPPGERVVIRRAEVELHAPLDVLSRAAQVRSNEIGPNVTTADRNVVALANRERYDNSANSVGRRFQEFVEKLDLG